MKVYIQVLKALALSSKCWEGKHILLKGNTHFNVLTFTHERHIMMYQQLSTHKKMLRDQNMYQSGTSLCHINILYTPHSNFGELVLDSLVPRPLQFFNVARRKTEGLVREITWPSLGLSIAAESTRPSVFSACNIEKLEWPGYEASPGQTIGYIYRAGWSVVWVVLLTITKVIWGGVTDYIKGTVGGVTDHNKGIVGAATDHNKGIVFHLTNVISTPSLFCLARATAERVYDNKILKSWKYWRSLNLAV